MAAYILNKSDQIIKNSKHFNNFSETVSDNNYLLDI